MSSSSQSLKSETRHRLQQGSTSAPRKLAVKVGGQVKTDPKELINKIGQTLIHTHRHTHTYTDSSIWGQVLSFMERKYKVIVFTLWRAHYTRKQTRVESCVCVIPLVEPAFGLPLTDCAEFSLGAHSCLWEPSSHPPRSAANRHAWLQHWKLQLPVRHWIKINFKSLYFLI